MPRSRSDKLLTTALKLAAKVLEERASAADVEELALVVLELDDAIVDEGESPPKRWAWRAG